MDPIALMRVIFGALWAVVGVWAAQWGRSTWAEVDRSTFFATLVIASLMGAVVAWSGSRASGVTGLVGGALGLLGVTGYFVQSPPLTVTGMLGLAAAGLVVVALSSRGVAGGR